MPSGHSSARETFEERMRVRRAATCLTLARSAIASGRIVEATDRLEEACALDPNADDARLLLEELRLQEPVDSFEDADRVPVPRSELAAWSHWVAAGIAICMLGALAFLWPPVRPESNRGQETPPPQLQSPPAVTPQTAPFAVDDQAVQEGLAAQLADGAGSATGTSGSVPQAPTFDAPVPRSAAPPPAASQPAAPQPSAPQPLASGGQVGVSPANADAAAAGQLQAVKPEQRVSTAGAPAPAGQPPAPAANPPVTGAPVSQPPVERRAEATPAGGLGAAGGEAGLAGAPLARPALPPLERVAVTAEASKGVPSEATTSAPIAGPPASRADVPEEAALRVEASEAEIQETLHQYADAYARLDASAARRVWPTVDQRALARAFEGLESQGLQFDHCDFTVAGEDATAVCRGRARYVPKVGSHEPLVQQRQWSFRLRRGEAGWQILQAQAR